jgi:hypothetical protein
LLAWIYTAAGQLHLRGVNAALVDAKQSAIATDKQAVYADTVAVGASRYPRFANAFHRCWIARNWRAGQMDFAAASP